MNGVLSVFQNVNSWAAKTSISELISWSWSSTNFGRIPSTFHWFISEMSWQSLWRKWVRKSRKLTISRFNYTILLKVGALFTFPLIITGRSFQSSAAFWWNSLVHALHLTRTVLERKAGEHLAHFSWALLASAIDKPWFKRDFNDRVVGCGGEVSGWVGGCPLAGVEECRWQSSCVSSGIYKATACGCKMTEIIAGWICTMVS